MENLNTNSSSLSSDAINSSTSVDPLMEQMRSTLRLGPSASTFQRLERRFSDADRPFVESRSVNQGAVSVQSRDGSRWLPAPDEVSHRVGLGSSSTEQPHEREPPTQLIEEHSCNSAVCAVSKVFETTELLELTLSFLDTKDVLALRRTNQHWHSTIEQSPQLRLHFFTYGQFNRPGAQFQILPLRLPGLSIERGEELHLGQWISISFTQEAARRICPESRPSRRVRSRSIYEGLRGGLGSRRQTSTDPWPTGGATPRISNTIKYEDLFVSQPPLVGMQAFIVYSRTTGENSEGSEETEAAQSAAPACAKLNCDAGVTLGFLAETAQNLLASHLQSSGPSNVTTTDVRVVFKAIMSFCAPQESPRKRNNSRLVTRI